jgi:hypothetical protein
MKQSKEAKPKSSGGGTGVARQRQTGWPEETLEVADDDGRIPPVAAWQSSHWFSINWKAVGRSAGDRGSGVGSEAVAAAIDPLAKGIRPPSVVNRLSNAASSSDDVPSAGSSSTGLMGSAFAWLPLPNNRSAIKAATKKDIRRIMEDTVRGVRPKQCSALLVTRRRTPLHGPLVCELDKDAATDVPQCPDFEIQQ